MVGDGGENGLKSTPFLLLLLMLTFLMPLSALPVNPSLEDARACDEEICCSTVGAVVFV